MPQYSWNTNYIQRGNLNWASVKPLKKCRRAEFVTIPT